MKLGWGQQGGQARATTQGTARRQPVMKRMVLVTNKRLLTVTPAVYVWVHEKVHAAGEEFEDKVGSAAEGSPDHLRNGLWAASQLISTGSSRANKRLLIFTRDENPAGTGSKAESHR